MCWFLLRCKNSVYFAHEGSCERISLKVYHKATAHENSIINGWYSTFSTLVGNHKHFSYYTIKMGRYHQKRNFIVIKCSLNYTGLSPLTQRLKRMGYLVHSRKIIQNLGKNPKAYSSCRVERYFTKLLWRCWFLKSG